MRVEALALLRRYAGADRRSGPVPPVPARSSAHAAARRPTSGNAPRAAVIS
ncbi:hypothetical protein BKA18_003502 [Streptomyces auratus]